MLGLYFAEARMYDAANRRFVSVDLFAGVIFKTSTLVSYLYVSDNPLKYIDLLGTYEELYINGTYIRQQVIHLPDENGVLQPAYVGASLFDLVSAFNGVSFTSPSGTTWVGSIPINDKGDMFVFGILENSYMAHVSYVSNTYTTLDGVAFQRQLYTGTGKTNWNYGGSSTYDVYIDVKYFLQLMCDYELKDKIQTIDIIERKQKEIAIGNEINRQLDLIKGHDILSKPGDRAELLSLETVEILARLMLHETDTMIGHTAVMWSVINRVFKGDGFKSAKGNGTVSGSIRGMISASNAYTPLDSNNKDNRSYRPSRDLSDNQENWKNCQILAAIACAYLGDKRARDFSKDDKLFIREGIANRTNVKGDKLTNLIGERDSFLGRISKSDARRDSEYYIGGNFFFVWPNKRG